MSTEKFAHVAALAWVLCYLLLGLLFLDQLPIVHEDEPWIASTGWSLAERGVFGSPMFEGMDGMGERYYEFMPLYPLVQAVLFRGAGVGLFQARFVSVIAGALTLCLTFAVGRKLFSATVGAAAMLVLLVGRMGVGTLYLPTGILFLDVNRLGRYDALVPVLGLSALAVFLAARTRGKPYLFLLAGVLGGLAGLAHLYGVFWGAGLVLLAFATPSKIRTMGAVLGGFALPWCVYALYLVMGLDAWRAQQHWNAGRFDVLDGAWVVQNILTESMRYGIPEMVSNPQAHIGTLVLCVGWFATSCIFVWRAWRMRDTAAQMILVLTACLVGGLTILVSSKISNYLLTLMPLVALACGWGIVQLWGLGKHRGYRQVLRGAAVLPVAILILDSAWHTLPVYATAARVTPYAQIGAALRGQLASGTRVVGLHSTWFAYADMDYRNILVIFDRARLLQASKNPVGKALTEFDPQVIVIDPRFEAYLDTAKIDPRPAQIRAWMRGQNFQCIWSVGEETQGYFEVYERASSAASDSTNKPCAIQLTAFPVRASSGALPTVR